MTTDGCRGALTGSRGRGRGVAFNHSSRTIPALGEEGGVRGGPGRPCPCEAWFTLGQRGPALCGILGLLRAVPLGCICWLPGNFCRFHDLPSPVPCCKW